MSEVELNIERLKALAVAATPGPWWIDSHGHAMVSHADGDNCFDVIFQNDDRLFPAVRHENTGNLSHWRNDADASYIAAANPKAILDLIENADQLRQKLGAAESMQVVDVKSLIAEYEAADDDIGWESPHPIFLMAKENDLLRERVKSESARADRAEAIISEAREQKAAAKISKGDAYIDAEILKGFVETLNDGDYLYANPVPAMPIQDDKWQPIESIPDGVKVLILDK